MNFKMHENAKERRGDFIENSPIQSKCPGTNNFPTTELT